MNAARRKALVKIIKKLEALDELRQEIYEALEEIKDEEQEALENMPESLQESERGEQMQDGINTMEYVLDDMDMIAIDDLVDQLREIVEV